MKIRAHPLRKNEKRPLPVAVRGSKTPLLKLPIISLPGYSSTAEFLFSTFFSDISYHMTIKTGDQLNAGTDANVYFALHGDKGKTPKIALQDESQTFRRFERGRADKFVVQTADVGKVGH